MSHLCTASDLFGVGEAELCWKLEVMFPNVASLLEVDGGNSD